MFIRHISLLVEILGRRILVVIDVVSFFLLLLISLFRLFHLLLLAAFTLMFVKLQYCNKVRIHYIFWAFLMLDAKEICVLCIIYIQHTMSVYTPGICSLKVCMYERGL